VSSDKDSVIEVQEILARRKEKIDSSCALGSETSVPTDISLPKEKTACLMQSAKTEEGLFADTSTLKTIGTEKSTKFETQHLDTNIAKENLAKPKQATGVNSTDESVSITTPSRGCPLGAKSTFTKESSALSPTSPPSIKKKKSGNSDSRFDAETLELIREIGSAFLNSPDKINTEKQTAEQKAEEGGSLVKFLVHNIEKNTATTKKKHLKEIIIIDKDTQEKKKKVWKFHGLDAESVTVPGVSEQNVTEKKQKAKLTTSFSSPALVIPRSLEKEFVGTDRKQKSFESVSTDEFSSTVSSNTQLETSSLEADKSDLACSTEDNDTTDVSDGGDTVKVKNLVGKFELSDKQPCVKPTLLSSPVKETKMLIIEQNTDNKNEDRTTLSNISLPQSNLPKDVVSSEVTITCSADECRVIKEVSECSKDESDSDQSVELRNLRQNLRKTGTRPKSAEPIRGGNTSPGKFREQLKLTHAHALPSPEELTFTWEGKKVRKLHGKTHPLSKLETKRKHPFYNTM